MTYSKISGTIKLVGCFVVDGDLVQAKSSEASQVTYFADSVSEQAKVTIDMTGKKVTLLTSNGDSQPVSIDAPTNKGTKYTFHQNNYIVEVWLKKVVGTVKFKKK